MEAMKDLRAFILIIIILAFVWLFTGGPLRSSSKSGWFLNKPQQKETQKTKEQTEEILGTSSKSKIQDSSSSQALPTGQAGPTGSDFVALKTGRAKETNPDKEYLEIKADKKNNNSVKITGWKLKGRVGLDIEIGQGTFYYYDSASQPQEDIYLKPGEKAVIITGQSPLGTSFKINKCLGHLEQFHEFVPNLNIRCPALKNEELPSNLNNNDQCLDYIDQISACATVVSIPYKDSSRLSSSCQDYIMENANYKSCSAKHKSDTDFYLPEWRIYLNRSEEMWKKERENIALYDDKNNIVDSVSY